MIIDAPPEPVQPQACNTRACVRRVQRKHKRRFVRPFRGWLLHVRTCESHGDYTKRTGNGFYGAYQFALRTWVAAGGHGYPDLNPPYEQDYRAVRWRLIIGNPHSTAGWPVCG